MIKLIENTTDLNEFCQQMAQEEFITVDLEFVREKTYYAKLCLIQVGSLSDCAIIDPLAHGIDLKAFFDLMDNPQIIKVFHAGRQDLEIIYLMHHQLPAPLFDTQVAAQVCGFGESVGYETLVKSLLELELDKSCRFTNWEARPLDTRQLEYAACDVTHLVPIYQKLKNQLAETNRENWFQEEIEHLLKPEIYNTDPYQAWRKIKHRSHNAKFLTTLRELAAWREKRAQNNDINRKTIIKDECLLNIAALCPQNTEELSQIRGIRKDFVEGKLGREILDMIEFCEHISEDNYVKPPKEHKVSARTSALLEILKLLLKLKSQESGVASKLIASEEDLTSLIRRKETPLLKGWRYEIFGKDALGFCEGKLCLSFDTKSNTICISTPAVPQTDCEITEPTEESRE